MSAPRTLCDGRSRACAAGRSTRSTTTARRCGPRSRAGCSPARYVRFVVLSRVRGLTRRQYNDGVPEDSRFAQHKDFFKDTLDSLSKEEGLAKLAKVKKLTELAEKSAPPSRKYCYIRRTDDAVRGRARVHDRAARARVGRALPDDEHRHPRRDEARAGAR